jgi:hypothetical protein
MRITNIVLSALLVSSIVGEPALAAANDSKEQQKSEQEKRRPQPTRRAPPKKEEKGGGFAIHPSTRKSDGSGSNWLSGNHGRWSF